MKASSLYFFITICLLLVLSGCSRSSNGEKKEARLYLQTSPLSLDPRIGGNRMSLTVTRQLFEGLVRIDADGSHKPALAKTISLSDDGCVYTFTLHPSKWSNGEDVTAHDFEYAWKTMLDPSFPTSFSYVLYDIKNAVEAYQKKCPVDDVGIKAIDPLTLQVTLKNPAPYFLELLAMPLFSPICRSHCEKGTSAPEYVSNGPFTLKQHDLNSQILLEKNPLYWSPYPTKLDKMSFTIIEDPQTVYNMFCTGQLDWFGEPCGVIPLDMVGELDPKDLHREDIGQCTWLRCQRDMPLLSSLSVRKALASAIDRSAICERLLKCGEIPAQTVLAKYLSLLSDPPFKDGGAEEARRLFEMGLNELGLTKETCPSLTIQYRCDDQTLKAVAEIIQEQVGQTLGIEVILQDCDYGSLLARFFSGDFQLCLLEWTTFYQDPGYTLGWFKHENWGDPIFREYLDKADASVDIKDRQKYLKLAEERFTDQLPVIPVIHRNSKYLKSKNLHGEALSAVGQMDFKWVEKTG